MAKLLRFRAVLAQEGILLKEEYPENSLFEKKR